MMADRIMPNLASKYYIVWERSLLSMFGWWFRDASADKYHGRCQGHQSDRRDVAEISGFCVCLVMLIIIKYISF